MDTMTKDNTPTRCSGQARGLIAVWEEKKGKK